jgi:hypothetical protein
VACFLAALCMPAARRSTAHWVAGHTFSMVEACSACRTAFLPLLLVFEGDQWPGRVQSMLGLMALSFC